MRALSDTLPEGWFPLIAAVDAGDGEAVATLLEAGDDANQAVAAPSEHPTLTDWEWIGLTPLLLATLKGDEPLVEMLLGHEGIKVDKTRLGDGATAVFMAAENDHLEIIRLLAEKGANLDLARRVDGAIPVLIAAYKGHNEVVRVLADKGANLDLVDEETATTVFVAAQEGNYELVVVLANKGANLDLAMEDGCTPVSMAAENGHHEVVRLLADRGANLDLADENGVTPLSVAVREGHDEVVDFLSTWRQYLRHQYGLIRLRVGATYATLPVGHKKRALYHYAYGRHNANAPVAAEDAMLPSNLLPDDLWPLVVRYLVGDGNGTARG